MRISVTDAKDQLDDLVRRAAAGDEVVLTSEGEAEVRLVADEAKSSRRQKISAEEWHNFIVEIQASAARNMTPGPDAAKSQDFLYDEFGLPK